MKNKLFEMYSNCPEDFERFVAALRETYRYDPTTGVMSRLKSSGGARAGSTVGSDNGKGYLRCSFQRSLYLVHILIYVLVTGEMVETIDHRDLDKKNNAWDNLRPTNKSGNEKNTTHRVTSTTGVKNVYWIAERNKFRVQFKVEGKTKTFGYYTTLEESAQVAKSKRLELHGEFARS